MVAAASPLAQSCGVRLDMPLAEAKSLLYRSGRAQAFHILPYDPAADLYAIEKLADELDAFSPIVGLQQEVDHPDCIFLDVTGLSSLFGGEFKLAAGVEQFCRDTGYLVEIAVADTIGAAEALAKFGESVQGKESVQCSEFSVQKREVEAPAETPSLREDRSLSSGEGGCIAAQPLAAQHSSGDVFRQEPQPPETPPSLQEPQPPHSKICIPHCPQETLKDLPVAALRLSDWATETLHQLGVSSIGQLLQLPRQALAARFGDEIHKRLDQLSGKLAEPIIARNAPSEFYAEQLLEYPTSHCETIEVIIQRLVENICTQLAAVQRGALQWTIRLYGQHKLPLKLCVSLFEPTAAAEHVMQLATMQLEQLLMSGVNKPRKSKKKKRSTLRLSNQPLQVNEITVGVTSCVLLVQKQRQLFDENPRLDKHELAHLINRLSGRLGRQQVLYPTIVSGAQPEYSFQFRPLVDPHRKRARRTVTATIANSSHVISRPLRMFRPAIRLHAQCDRANDPQDAQFILDEQTHIVANRWGPERIETGWWRGRTTRRDYWRVETDKQQQFWIYRDLRRRAWFLQGEF